MELRWKIVELVDDCQIVRDEKKVLQYRQLFNPKDKDGFCDEGDWIDVPEFRGEK